MKNIVLRKTKLIGIIACTFLCLTLAVVSLTLFGCQSKVNIRDCNSEITKIYYHASCQGAMGSISVGQREKTYIVDGKHTENCDFSLISIKFSEQITLNQIEVDLSINDKTEKLTLDFNPANHYYMGDLGYALGEEDKIALTFSGYELSFENVSKNFKLNYNEVIDLALKEFGNELDEYYKKGSFEGECYLMVLSEDTTDNQLFWVYTIVAQGKQNKRIVIGVYDGNVLIKN